MTYTETLRYMESLRSVGILPGTDRILQAAHAVGDPQSAFDAVHITGTNGKGSTAAMIAAALTANGHSVGLYTSPVVTDFGDTVLINGKPIDKELLAAQATALRNAVPTGLSEFEFATLLAFCCFKAAGVRVAVIECGMGGAGDATNILPPPLCAVITPIALDHAAFLGDTIEDIAAQKSGIIKTGCRTVCAPNMHEDALGVIFERAAVTQATVALPSLSSVSDAVFSARGCRFHYNNIPFTLSLCGKHQLTNALTALEVLSQLTQQGYRIDISRVADAFAVLSMPCRQEWVNDTVMLDGAHNPHGISTLADTLSLLDDRHITLVIGMLKDKDVTRCIETLAPFCRKMVCCTPDNPRAMSAKELCAVAEQHRLNATAIASPIEAYQYAKKIAANDTIVIGGSFYTASMVRRYLLKQNTE